MKQLYILIILWLCSQSIKSQSGQVYQYFDGANTTPSTSILVTIQTSSTNIWQIGKPQKTLFSSASTTPNVIVTDTISYYPSKNVSTFTFAMVNSFPWGPGSIMALRWKQKLDMDQGLDGGIVEYSTNSGSTWVNSMNNPSLYNYYGWQPASKDTLPTGQYCFSGTDNVWRDIWLCMSPMTSSLNDTIMFKFTFKLDSINTNKEGWMIDNMMGYFTLIHPVKQASQSEYLSVYPNITNGMLNVEAKKYKDDDAILKMELVNMEGKVVETFGHNKLKVVLDISKHPAGLYHLNVVTNRKSTSHAIILEKN